MGHILLSYQTEEDRNNLILVELTKQELGYDSTLLGRHSSQQVYFKCVVCSKPHLQTKKRILDAKGLTHPGACRDLMRSLAGRKARANEDPITKQHRIDCQRKAYQKKNPEIVAKRRKTTLEKYGVEHHSQIPEIKEKMKVGIQLAYEDRKEEIIAQRQQTNLDRYGSTNFLTSEEGKEIVYKSNQEKFATNYPFQSSYIRDQLPKIIQAKYGVENIRQHPSHRNKLNQWCEENPEKLFTSKGEQEILDWVLSYYPSAKKHKQEGHEIDIFIPEINLGIEYNGLYWHGESGLKRKDHNARTYHLEKTKYFEGNNIRLIHIWEHEWKNRKHQVQSFILSAINKNSIKLNPRKCKIIWSNSKQEIQKAHNLLDDYHIQGHVNSTRYVTNIYYNNELVATATFGKHHRNSTDWVLSRFCAKMNYTIRGLLGKISKLAYLNLNQPLISWADYRLSQGNGYLKAGWKLEETLPPDYFYHKGGQQIVSKQSRQKKMVNTPEDMTEYEHAKLDGLERVWDCGKIRFIYGGLA